MRERDHTVSATHGDMDQVRGVAVWVCRFGLSVDVWQECWAGLGMPSAGSQSQHPALQPPMRSALLLSGHPATPCPSPSLTSYLFPSLLSTPPACPARALPQNTRDVIMREFRSGSSRVLITTDLLARGIDVQQVRRLPAPPAPPLPPALHCPCTVALPCLLPGWRGPGMLTTSSVACLWVYCWACCELWPARPLRL